MTPLDSFALAFGTDKSSSGHDYAAFYDQLLGHLRDKECSMIEFGVRAGASMAMWEHGFPKAKIVGVDFKPERMNMRLSRTVIEEADLRDIDSVRRICSKHGPFDFAIDDSAHTAEVAQNIVDVMWPDYIKPGGWLVIEDINSGYKRDLRPDQQHDFIGWAANFVRAVNHHGNLCRCGPGFWERSTEFDKAIRQIVYVPGIMAMQRR